jgi:hypothetical protein
MLPLACVLLPSRFVIGCAGLWQLCDAVRAVGCRSRFVLLAQQANSSLMRQFAGTDPHDLERRRCVFNASQKSSHRRLARGRMTAFFALRKLAAWPWQHKTPLSLPHRCGK